MATSIDVTFLRDVNNGGKKSQPQDIAKLLANFVKQAKRSLHISIYDFRLQPDNPFVKALIAAANKGVEVQIAYDHTKPDAATPEPFQLFGADPAPKGTHEFLPKTFGPTKVQIKPITPVKARPIAGTHLMHNKYIIRDGSAVLMGSANFTDAAWSLQENNIVEVSSRELAKHYESDFQDLWTTEDIAKSGKSAGGTVIIDTRTDAIRFAPADGAAIDQAIATAISKAKKKVRVSSMVISSHKILPALAKLIDQGLDVQGIYDLPEMNDVEKLWQKSNQPATQTQLQLWQKKVKPKLLHKRSNAYSKTNPKPHNFMHNKVAVIDDQVVVTGSFNLSSNATKNAENNLVINDPAWAQKYSKYVDDLLNWYKPRQ